MRRYLALLVLTAVAAVALVRAPGAAGEPAPTTVPEGSTKITVQYTYRGVPVIATASQLSLAYADGQTCSLLTTQRVVSFPAIWNHTGWPWPSSYAEGACQLAPATVRICEVPSHCSPEFPYEGGDILVSWPIDALYEPFPDARIAVARFIHQGLPQTVTVQGWLFESGATTCTSGVLGSSASNPPAAVRELGIVMASASKCAGQTQVVTFNTVEFGELHGSFVWQGEDLHYNIDTGAFAQTPSPGPSPTLTPSPAVSPAALPDAGGTPESDRSPSAGLLAGLGAAAVGVIAASVAATQRCVVRGGGHGCPNGGRIRGEANRR